jgi:phosphoglycerate dehydrogenase-like enzyme
MPEAIAPGGAPLGQMLAGRTVCLYGLGATAYAIARRIRAFDERLMGIARRNAWADQCSCAGGAACKRMAPQGLGAGGQLSH